MARKTETPPAKGPRAADGKAERSLRRAEALRRNLRRRKDQARGRAEAPPQGSGPPERDR